MSTELFKLLDNQVTAREWTKEKQELEEMCALYEGELPAQYKHLFPKASPQMLVQVISLAHNDLATQVGRVPDLRVEPRNKTQKEETAAGKLEKIGHYILRKAKPTAKLLMQDLAWWLQLGRAIAIVTPDFENQCPRIELRDPRTCYPGIAESVNNRIVKLSDLIFKYELDIHEARLRGLAPPVNLNRFGKDDAARKVKVIEYIDDQKWCIVSEHGMSIEAEHGLGMVPGWVFQSFTPNKVAGHNRFRDQVSLMVAISRLISAKMAFADRLIHPILWSRGHEGAVEVGPYVINKLGPQGELGQISPPTHLQVDQDIQMLDRFSRVLNRNPEVRQGEIAAKGTYTSAKTLEQLADAIDTVVGADWDIIGPGMEYLFGACFEMMMVWWPDVEYSISGSIRGERYLDSFVPSKDIGDRRDIRVEYGFGVGGYQGFLMHLQAGDAKYMPKRMVMESMPGISDVAGALRELELDALNEAAQAAILAQAAQGTLDLRMVNGIMQKVAKDGVPLLEAIGELQEEIAAQAMAAQGTDMGALTAPLPEEQPAEAELPGIPPAVLAGV